MDTKREIVLAMKEVFAEKGYMASISDVSKIVGIKVPSIYSQYHSKDEIIYLCVQDEIETFTQYYRSHLRRTHEESVEFSMKYFFFSYIAYFKDLKK